MCYKIYLYKHVRDKNGRIFCIFCTEVCITKNGSDGSMASFVAYIGLEILHWTLNFTFEFSNEKETILWSGKYAGLRHSSHK